MEAFSPFLAQHAFWPAAQQAFFSVEETLVAEALFVQAAFSEGETLMNLPDLVQYSTLVKDTLPVVGQVSLRLKLTSPVLDTCFTMLASAEAALSASVMEAEEQEVFSPAAFAAQQAFFWASAVKANKPMNANRKNNFFILNCILLDEMIECESFANQNCYKTVPKLTVGIGQYNG
jgi:hypothetical protein